MDFRQYLIETDQLEASGEQLETARREFKRIKSRAFTANKRKTQKCVELWFPFELYEVLSKTSKEFEVSRPGYCMMVIQHQLYKIPIKVNQKEVHLLSQKIAAVGGLINQVVRKVNSSQAFASDVKKLSERVFELEQIVKQALENPNLFNPKDDADP